MELTIVVSTGRCGSTMLSRILHLHPEVLSVSEFFTSLIAVSAGGDFLAGDLAGPELWRLLSVPVPALDLMVRDGLKFAELRYPYGRGRFDPVTGVPMLCQFVLPCLTDDPDALFDELAGQIPSWPRRPAVLQYRAVFELLAGLLGRRVIVERSGGSLPLLSPLRRAFPDARFVHMHRDGPATALSMSRFPPLKMAAITSAAIAAAKLPPGTPPESIEAALPPRFKGMIAPPFDAAKVIAHPIPPKVFGRLWSGLISAGVTDLRALPAGTWTSVGYGDLIGPGLVPELTRLASFIGIPATAAWLDRSRALVVPDRSGDALAQLDPAALADLRAACAPGERALATMAGHRGEFSGGFR